jgi:hypothetical protein
MPVAVIAIGRFVFAILFNTLAFLSDSGPINSPIINEIAKRKMAA